MTAPRDDLIVSTKGDFFAIFGLLYLGAPLALIGYLAFASDFEPTQGPSLHKWIARLLFDLPPWLRGGLMLAVGCLFVAFAAWHILEAMRTYVLLVVSPAGLEMRVGSKRSGDMRRIPWHEISALEIGPKAVSGTLVTGEPVTLDLSDAGRKSGDIREHVERLRPGLLAPEAPAAGIVARLSSLLRRSPPTRS